MEEISKQEISKWSPLFNKHSHDKKAQMIKRGGGTTWYSHGHGESNIRVLLVNFKKIKFCLSATEQGKMRGRVKRDLYKTFYILLTLSVHRRRLGRFHWSYYRRATVWLPKYEIFNMLGTMKIKKIFLLTLLKPQKAPSFIMEILFWLRLIWSSSLETKYFHSYWFN